MSRRDLTPPATQIVDEFGNVVEVVEGALRVDANITGFAASGDVRVTDGAGLAAAVKAGSTAPVAGDPALVVALSPNGASIDIGDVTVINGAGGAAVNVQDGGNSLTIDNATLAVVGGGVEAAALRVTLASDSSGLVSVDDNGASLTVDSAQLPGALVGGRLDANVGAWLGSTAPTVGQKTMAASVPMTLASNQTDVPVKNDGVVSTANSTSTPLGGGGVFNGTSEDVLGYASFSIFLFANVAGAPNAIQLEWSTDNVNWDYSETCGYAGNFAHVMTREHHARYFRLTFTNGAGAQAAFRLQVIHHLWMRSGLLTQDAEGDNAIGSLQVNAAIANVAAPSRTEGYPGPLWTDLSGRLQVTAVANQGDAGPSGVPWPVALTEDGTDTLVKVADDASKAVRVHVVALTAAGGLNLVAQALDDAAFDVGTDYVLPAGALFDDAAPDSVDEGDIGVPRMSANRNLYQTIRDAAGNERGANVTAANALKVDGSAVTQPVSDAGGSLTVDSAQLPAALVGGRLDVVVGAALPTGTNNIGDVDVLTMPGTVAEDAVSASGATSVLIAGVRNDAAATKTDADGDYSNIALDAAGRVGIADLGGSITIDGTVTANAGTNLNTSLLALESGGNLATIAGIVSASRAAVNPIAGQAGVQGASGVVTALTQRVVLATDVALPTGANTIGAVTNTVLSVVGGGTEAAAQRVTIANDSTGVLSVDDNGGSLTVDAPAGTPVNVQIGDGTRQATVRDTGASDSLNVAIVDASGNQITSFGGGTQYNVNDAAPADPTGPTLVAERDDQLATVAEAEGDWTNVRATAKGALWVAIPDTNGDPITSFGGGTQYAEDTAKAAGEQVTMAGVIRADAAATQVDTDGDRTELIVDGSGRLWVNGSGVTQPVSDAGASLTVDNATLSVVGGGTEAAALRVTIANDSTGVLSVDDNGGSITVDAASLPLPTGAATLAEQQTQTTALQLIDNLPHTMNAAFAGAVAIGGQLDDAAVTAATENNIAPVRITAQRGLHSNLRDDAGLSAHHAANAAYPGATGLVGVLPAYASDAVAGWGDGAIAPLNVDTATGALRVSGTLTNDNAAPAASKQIGVLPAIASSSAQAYTNGRQALPRLNLAGDTAVTLDGEAVTANPTRPSTGTRTQVADNAADVQILASNASRLGATVYNDSTAILYLGMGTTAASTTNYSVQIPPGGYWECPNNFTGELRGIWATDPNTGAARVTELT